MRGDGELEGRTVFVPDPNEVVEVEEVRTLSGTGWTGSDELTPGRTRVVVDGWVESCPVRRVTSPCSDGVGEEESGR